MRLLGYKSASLMVKGCGGSWTYNASGVNIDNDPTNRALSYADNIVYRPPACFLRLRCS